MQTGITSVRAKQRGRAIWLVLAAVGVLALLVLGILYRRHLLSGVDLVAEVTGGRMSALLSLALGLLVLAWIFVWLLFPIFVYFGLRDLRRRTADLERTTELCARHLAQLTAEQQGSKPQPVPGEQVSEGESS